MTTDARQLFEELERVERNGGLDRETFVRLGAEIVEHFRDRPQHVRGDIVESVGLHRPDQAAWDALLTELRSRQLL